MKKSWSNESQHIPTIPADNYFFKRQNILIIILSSSHFEHYNSLKFII